MAIVAACVRMDITETVCISVVTVNQTDTETTVFCYLRASTSPWCFRPKMAQHLCIFIFLSVPYIYSTIFLPFAWRCHQKFRRKPTPNIARHQCLYIAVCGHQYGHVRQTLTNQPQTVWLLPLPMSRQSHLSRTRGMHQWRLSVVTSLHYTSWSLYMKDE